MGRVDDERWLDEALTGALHSDDTQPDFRQWKASHPEAVEQLTSRTPPAQRPPVIRRIRMNGMLIKLAAAAVIAVAAIVGVTQFMHLGTPEDSTMVPTSPKTLTGAMTHTFDDGSVAKLAENAGIRTYSEAGKRGFELVAGQVAVTVAEGKGEFLVTTPYGDVKALGTQFTLELVDGVDADTKEPVNLLSVEVTEGKVEVYNEKGHHYLEASQEAIVEKDAAPYDFNQDNSLPARLRERIALAVTAMEAGDAKAYIANYNVDYMFRLIKRQEQYDPQRFGGSAADLERLRQGLADVASPQDMTDRFLATGGIRAQGKLYIRSVKLNEAGDHAEAQCLERKSETHLTITTPRWHYFDNDWWQVDD